MRQFLGILPRHVKTPLWNNRVYQFQVESELDFLLRCCQIKCNKNATWVIVWPNLQIKTFEESPYLNSPHALPLILSEIQNAGTRSRPAVVAWHHLKAIDTKIKNITVADICAVHDGKGPGPRWAWTWARTKLGSRTSKMRPSKRAQQPYRRSLPNRA